MRLKFSRPLIGLCGLLLAAACQPDKSPTAPRLTRRTVVSSGTQELIPNSYVIVFKRDSAGTPEMTNRFATKLSKRFGGRVTFVYDALGGYAVDSMPPGIARLIEREPGVAYVEQNGVIRTSAITQPNPGVGLDRLDQTNRPLDGGFSYAYDGTGVNVYIIDTGVDTTGGEFSGRVGVGKTCVSQGGPYQSSDSYGHGTGVASIAVGTIHGVAKNATLHSVRISGDVAGTSTDAISTCGINWVASYGVRPAVANMSFGAIPNFFAIRDAINNVTTIANIPFVKSAGNASDDAYKDRANRATYEFVVGAVDPRYDTFAWFSNYGVSAAPSVNMLAPGVQVPMADKFNPGYEKLGDGTSFAAPYVTGVIAQYLHNNPTAPPWIVMDAINVYTTTYDIVQGLTGAAAETPNKLQRSLMWCVPTC